MEEFSSDERSSEKHSDDEHSDNERSNERSSEERENKPQKVIAPLNPFADIKYLNDETKIKTKNEIDPYYEQNTENKELIDNINVYLSGRTSYKGIVVRGKIGTGKVTFLKKFLEQDYEIILINDEITEDLLNKLKKLLTSNTEQFNNLFKLKPKVLILKNYDTIRPDYLKIIFGLITKKTYKIPTFLTTINLSKSFSIQKCFLEYLFKPISRKCLLNIGKKILGNEKLDVLNEIIDECKGDIPHFILQCHYAKSNVEGTNTRFKDIEYNITDSLNYIYSHDLIDSLVYSDIHTNTVIQENYLNFYSKCLKKSTNESLDNLVEILDYITLGDIHYDHAINTMIWDTGYYAFYGTVCPMKKLKNIGLECVIEKDIKYPKVVNNSFTDYQEFITIKYVLVNIINTIEQLEEFLEYYYRKSFVVLDYTLKIVKDLKKFNKSQVDTLIKRINVYE